MSEPKKRYPPNNVTAKRKPCIDCIAEGLSNSRKAPYPGPRCHTHHRIKKLERQGASWEKRLQATYSITPEQYFAIYEAQGGRCAICRRATGAKRRLSVDHDHACCNGPTSCGACVRMLACSTCNKMLGHARDSVEFFERAIDVLLDPPAQRVLIHWRT